MPDVSAGPERFQLVDWQVVPAFHQLTIDGKTYELEPKVMQLLVCLHRHLGQVVTKEQFFEEVWHGEAISDDSIYTGIAKLRKIFKQVEEHRSPQLKTVPKQGYLLCDKPAYQVYRSTPEQESPQPIPVAAEPESAASEEPLTTEQQRDRRKTDRAQGKRLADDAELKLARLELFGNSEHRAPLNKGYTRSKGLKILLYLCLVIILVQAAIILFK